MLAIANPVPGEQDDADRTPNSDAAPRLDWRTYVALFRNAPYRRVVLGYAAYTFALGGIQQWMPAFLQRVRGVSEQSATTHLGAILVVTGFLGTFLGGWIGDMLEQRVRRGYLWLSGATMILATPLAYVALTAPASGTYWGALTAASLLLFLSTSPINAVIVGDVSPAARAAAMAASIFTIHLLGDVPAPLLIGRLSDLTSLAQAVLVVPVAIVVGGAVWLYAAGRRV
jgi:sugar phosphate permease